MTRRTSLVTGALALLALVAVLASAPPALAGPDAGIVMLVNPRNPTKAMSSDDAKKMFLGQTGFWNGVVPVKLVMRSDTDPATGAFLSNVMGMSAQAFHNHWDKLQLAGRAVAPVTATGLDALAKQIAATPGAIGFALATEVSNLGGVKVVALR